MFPVEWSSLHIFTANFVSILLVSLEKALTLFCKYQVDIKWFTEWRVSHMSWFLLEDKNETNQFKKYNRHTHSC